VWLVLEGPGGRTLHSRAVKPATETKKSFILVRSQDDTRAFVFMKGRGLAKGRYRFDFEFFREQAGQPTLIRAGSKSKETTFIECNFPPMLPT
jgi:hypothetical protein